MRYFKILLLIAVMFVGQNLWAQDTHFSQFYNSPMTLNPALTGKINGAFRIGVNYRNQWFGPINGKTTFSIPALAFDIPFVLGNGDAFGVGAYVVNDRSAGGKFNRLKFMLSGAFHKAFGKEKRHSLSLGLQFGYIQRRLDINNILFGNQIGPDLTVDPNAQSGENIDGTTHNVDLNAGLHWGSRFTDRVYVYAGISMFNMIQPFNTFTEGTDDLMRRISISGGLDARLAKRFSILPSLIFMHQANAQEINAGLSGAIDVSKEFILYTGVYYRVQDAVIPYLGADFKGVRLGLSYDINASSLGKIDGGPNGAVELSLIYVGKVKALPTVNPAMYCPRF